MKRQIEIFLAGVMVVAPLAVTVYVVWWLGSGLDGLVRSVVEAVSDQAAEKLPPGTGALVLVVGVYLVGLMTRVWGLRWVTAGVERLFLRLPVVRSLYESVRDMLKLFGGDPGRMGQVVRYRLPGTEVEVLGIQTSSAPRGAGREATCSGARPSTSPPTPSPRWTCPSSRPSASPPPPTRAVGRTTRSLPGRSLRKSATPFATRPSWASTNQLPIRTDLALPRNSRRRETPEEQDARTPQAGKSRASKVPGTSLMRLRAPGMRSRTACSRPLRRSCWSW